MFMPYGFGLKTVATVEIAVALGECAPLRLRTATVTGVELSIPMHLAPAAPSAASHHAGWPPRRLQAAV
jgi:hypothetical protein